MPDTSPFALLGLSAPLARAVAEHGYREPTAIQLAAIPVVLRGQDLLAAAPTGSGKTAAFALPILHRLRAAAPAAPRPVRALVLAPTRELAMQIGASMRVYGRYLSQRPKVLSVFGGVSLNPQLLALRGGADIVIATPGRLLDLVAHHALHLGDVTMLVLDEADRLFDLGFIDELRRILALLPAQRQNLLFSATFPDPVRRLADALLHQPVSLSVAAAPAATPAIQQRAIHVETPQRTQLLRHLIQTQRWSRLLVFVATQYATNHVADKLRRAGLQARAFSGDLSQGARLQTLADFKAGQLQVLVATDVAARGIDIAQLPAVVNYDLPRSAVDYLHRIGRTGRAGAAGVAVSFVTAESEAHFRLIEKRHGLCLTREVMPGFEPVPRTTATEEPAAASEKAAGGIKGRRGSKKDKLRAALAAGADARAAEPVLRGAAVWRSRKPATY